MGGDRLRVDLNNRRENRMVRSEPNAVTQDLGEINQLIEVHTGYGGGK